MAKEGEKWIAEKIGRNKEGVGWDTTPSNILTLSRAEYKLLTKYYKYTKLIMTTMTMTMLLQIMISSSSMFVVMTT